MQSAMKLTTTVLPGRRIEFDTPELDEGTRVELIVMPEVVDSAANKYLNVLDFIDSLTPIQRTPEEWAEVDRQFHDERNSWGD